MELIWGIISSPFKTGTNLGNSQHADGYIDDHSEQYALITSPHDVLKFDRKESTALCIGIDKQSHRQFAAKSLGNVVARDAEAMSEAFIKYLGLNHDRVKVHVSSAQPDDCTKMGVGALFVECAKAVEENGIFIFYYAGHGYMVGNRCILAPEDFVGMEDLNSGISGDDLVQWLHTSNCKANHVLVIFDCCYAGDLGISLTSPDNMLKIKPGVFVMCGCAAREKCMSVDALGHSIFTYFFLHYLERHQCRGEFAVKEAMEEITELCFNFSSLLISYDRDKGKLQPCKMNPTLDRLDFHEEEANMDEPDSGGRFELLFQLLDQGCPKPMPHPEVDKWLRSRMTQNALDTLQSKVTNSSEALQEGILCSMLYSAASIQYAHDKTHLEERNLFLMIAISVLGSIGIAYPEVNAPIVHLMSGLQYYRQPLIGKINMKFLDNLFYEMIKIATMHVPDNTSVTASFNSTKDGDDEVDGVAVLPNMLNKEIPQLRKLPSWEPLD